MRNRLIPSLVTVLLCLPGISSAGQGETESTEQPVAEQAASDSLMLRQHEEIKGFTPVTVIDQQIDAIYLDDSSGTRHGGVIVLHDNGETIRTEGVMLSLGQRLPTYGWATLAISLDYPYEPTIFLSASTEESAQESSVDNSAEQPPEPAASEAEPQTTDESAATTESEQSETDKTVPSNQQRLQSAIAFMESMDISQIVVLGHGNGSSVVMEMSETLPDTVVGFVMVSSGVLSNEQQLEKSRLPMLDVYASRDMDAVKQAAAYRETMMKRAGNTLYQQRMVYGADHRFFGAESQLVTTVRSWLHKIYIEPGTE